MLFIQLAIVLDVPLAYAHERWPTFSLLPLGGSEFAQIGCLLTAAYVLAELARLFEDWKGKARRQK